MVDEAPPKILLLDEPAPAGKGWRLASQLPEPARFWIRYVPRPRLLERHWPAPPGPWLDLSRGRLMGLELLGGPSSADPPPLPDFASEPLDDVLYLPPVAPERTGERDALVHLHRSRGTPVIVQVTADEATGLADRETAAGVHPVVDLTSALLSDRLELLDELAPASAVAWPLLPGLTDHRNLQEDACARLAAAGVEVLGGVVPELRPKDKRHLIEHFGDHLFDSLFHGDPPRLRDLARRAHAHGLAPFLERPVPRRPMLGIGNRRLAGWLALAAELEERLGRSPEKTQVLFRAARESDRTTYDLEALARDGNLGVLDWLSPEARRIVEEGLAGETPQRVRSLLEEYLA